MSTQQQELWFNGKPIESQVHACVMMMHLIDLRVPQAVLSSVGVQPGECLHMSVCSWVLEVLKLVALSRQGMNEVVLLDTLRQLGYTGDSEVTKDNWTTLLRFIAHGKLFTTQGCTPPIPCTLLFQKHYSRMYLNSLIYVNHSSHSTPFIM